jgi:hypothetical protein
MSSNVCEGDLRVRWRCEREWVGDGDVSVSVGVKVVVVVVEKVAVVVGEQKGGRTKPCREVMWRERREGGGGGRRRWLKSEST